MCCKVHLLHTLGLPIHSRCTLLSLNKWQKVMNNPSSFLLQSLFSGNELSSSPCDASHLRLPISGLEDKQIQKETKARLLDGLQRLSACYANTNSRVQTPEPT